VTRCALAEQKGQSCGMALAAPKSGDI
jgi:hypothetical protein